MTDNRTTERIDHPPRVRKAIDELMRKKDATSNRTTKLRAKLTERGVEYTTNDHMGVCETSWNGFTAMQLTPSAKLIMTVTPDQAIAATVGAGECDLVETESYSNSNEVVHVLECSACGKTCEHVNGSYPRCPHCGAKAVER